MLLILTQRVVEFLADAVLLLVSSAFLTGPVKSWCVALSTLQRPSLSLAIVGTDHTVAVVVDR